MEPLDWDDGMESLKRDDVKEDGLMVDLAPFGVQF